MSPLSILALSFLVGAALGSVYFLALWLSVRRIAERRQPGRWMALGLSGRLALALAALVLIVRWGGWPALVAALAGFVIARTVWVGRLRASGDRTESQP